MMSSSDCVLLRADAFRDKIYHRNSTAASALTSRNLPIEVSLKRPDGPLLPAILFVSVHPAVDFTEDNPPRIVRAVEDLFLIRVPIPVVRSPFDDEYDYDYFIYRPRVKKGPSLTLLPPAPTYLHDEDVGLLRRGEDHYIVAALLIGSKYGVYDLYRFDSTTEEWSVDEAPLVEPQVSFPCKKIPVNAERILFHLTSTAVTVGGKGGTMGWVDLWRSILVCDVLSTEPKLRGVPLPLPLDHLTCLNGLGVELGCPKGLRGIAFIDQPGMEPCLKFVHLGVTATPSYAEDSQGKEEEVWDMHDWKLTVWSNKKMSTSWEDWHLDCELKASDTTVSSELKSEMLKSGLLSPGGGTGPERAFHNLLVSFPAFGIDDGIVYLQAKVRFCDTKVFVLALDTRDNKLLGAVEFGTERTPGTSIVYIPSSTSKYIRPDHMNLITEGDYLSELSQYNGTRSSVFLRAQARLMRSIYSRLDDARIAT